MKFYQFKIVYVLVLGVLILSCNDSSNLVSPSDISIKSQGGDVQAMIGPGPGGNHDPMSCNDDEPNEIDVCINGPRELTAGEYGTFSVAVPPKEYVAEYKWFYRDTRDYPFTEGYNNNNREFTTKFLMRDQDAQYQISEVKVIVTHNNGQKGSVIFSVTVTPDDGDSGGGLEPPEGDGPLDPCPTYPSFDNPQPCKG